jgi:para-aminobenzoate synthetase component 1
MLLLETYLKGLLLDLIENINFYSKNRIPFFFLISYDLKKWDIITLKDMKNDILYSINKNNNKKIKNYNLNIIKPNYQNYQSQFNNVIKNIKEGNTYIFNLTCNTKITNKISLKNLFKHTNAKYKLYYKNKFLSFSPETFIQINKNKISSYPMKGTIDANILNAKTILLNDQKELAEHTMIVDLIRNDLGIVASGIKVESFRYIEKIKAGKKELLQTSSKITGILQDAWHNNLGEILVSQLPAGSITGTPKKSTVSLIGKIEKNKRNFFTGIWGIYDGKSLDSSILIRFIENNKGKYSYKSGGGITLDSDCQKEYDEMIDKIYIP